MGSFRYVERVVVYAWCFEGGPPSLELKTELRGIPSSVSRPIS